MTFHRAFTAAGALAIGFAVAAPCHAQEKSQEKPPGKIRLSKAEMSQYQGLHALVDAVMAGKQPAPADVALKLHTHFMQSAANVFVPYVLEVGSGKLGSFPVAVYVRAVPKPSTAAEPTSGSKPYAAADGKSDDYAFTDLYFFADSKGWRSTDSNTTEISRALELPPGEFDLYIALTETPPRNVRTAPAAKRAVLTHSLTVPDLSLGLTTSTIILGTRLEKAPQQQLTPQQQMEQPFTFGGYRITPTFTSTFPKSGELLFLFLVYNEGIAAGGKPDLDVDYNIFRAAEAKAFSKLATMSFNAKTLPAEFNLSAGHQVLVGQGIPLTRFAPGDYKLEIRVTDKTNSQIITRSVLFTVAA